MSYTIPGTTYRRQYRSKPRDQHMSLSDFAKCGALVWGFILLGWLIVFG